MFFKEMNLKDLLNAKAGFASGITRAAHALTCAETRYSKARNRRAVSRITK
jgi:hypothetical protein